MEILHRYLKEYPSYTHTRIYQGLGNRGDVVLHYSWEGLLEQNPLVLAFTRLKGVAQIVTRVWNPYLPLSWLLYLYFKYLPGSCKSLCSHSLVLYQVTSMYFACCDFLLLVFSVLYKTGVHFVTIHSDSTQSPVCICLSFADSLPICTQRPVLRRQGTQEGLQQEGFIRVRLIESQNFFD